MCGQLGFRSSATVRLPLSQSIVSTHAGSCQACMQGSCDADCLLCMQVYHQFHDGIGHPFPAEYKRDQKAAAMRSGRITFTGCPE